MCDAARAATAVEGVRVPPPHNPSRAWVGSLTDGRVGPRPGTSLCSTRDVSPAYRRGLSPAEIAIPLGAWPQKVGHAPIPRGALANSYVNVSPRPRRIATQSADVRHANAPSPFLLSRFPHTLVCMLLDAFWKLV